MTSNFKQTRRKLRQRKLQLVMKEWYYEQLEQAALNCIAAQDELASTRFSRFEKASRQNRTKAINRLRLIIHQHHHEEY